MDFLFINVYFHSHGIINIEELMQVLSLSGTNLCIHMALVCLFFTICLKESSAVCLTLQRLTY